MRARASACCVSVLFAALAAHTLRMMPCIRLPRVQHRRMAAFVLTFVGFMLAMAARRSFTAVKTTLINDVGITKKQLGNLESAYLSVYAASLFFLGHVGDECDRRWVVALGLFGSGVCSILFGFHFGTNHNLYGWLMLVWVFNGVFQSLIWPSSVAIISDWFPAKAVGDNIKTSAVDDGDTKINSDIDGDKYRREEAPQVSTRYRSFVFGVWTANMSIGAILGVVITNNTLVYGWQWSLYVPGFMLCAWALLLLLLLDPSPPMSAAGGHITENNVCDAVRAKYDREAAEPGGLSPSWDSSDATTPLLPKANGSDHAFDKGARTQAAAHAGRYAPAPNRFCFYSNQMASRFCALFARKFKIHAVAIRIRGVAAFALCFLLLKFTMEVIINWLPVYLKDHLHWGVVKSNYLSSPWSIGCLVGGIAVGLTADFLRPRRMHYFALAVLLTIATGMIYVYQVAGAGSDVVNGVIMSIIGLTLCGPSKLVMAAVPADLGAHMTRLDLSAYDPLGRPVNASASTARDGTNSSLNGGDVPPHPAANCKDSKSHASHRILSLTSTIAGIIDAFGSAGAAVEGVVTTRLEDAHGWSSVFYLLVLTSALSALVVWAYAGVDFARHKRDESLLHRQFSQADTEPLLLSVQENE